MITLQDAIERAKLAADESGLISSYTYDQLMQQLGDDDRYAFTMALVDLGIQTKLGSDASREAMVDVIAQDFYEEEDEEEDEDDDIILKASIIEDFVKVAQQFVQSPGGLWVPDTMEEAAPPEDEYESFLESSPFVFPHEQQYTPDEVSEEFSEVDIEQLQETVERAGMSLDEQGNVTLYKQNIPGLYQQKIPLKPIPLEKAIDRLNSEANNIDQEQTRISSLQDILSSLNSDFQEIELSADDLLQKFDDSYDNLEKFKYSEKSPDENIRSIAEGLSTVRNYIEQSTPSVDDLRSGLGQYSDTIQNLQGRLDNYYQTQYDKYDEKLATIDALERLKDMKDTSPEMFQEAVKGIGGVSASFRFAQKFEDSSQYGNIEIDVGEDFIKSVFDEVAPGKGEEIFQNFVMNVAPAGKFDAEFFEGLLQDLEDSYGVVLPEGTVRSEDEESSINLTDGPGVESYLGLWSFEEPDLSVGYEGGWFIDDYEQLDDVEAVKSEIAEDLGYYANMYLKGDV